MKHNTKSSGNVNSIAGVALSVLFIFLFVWFVRSLSAPSQDNAPTTEEEAQYEEYESEQRLDENAEQEACIDQMDRDVERYGEQVIDTYDCSQR